MKLLDIGWLCAIGGLVLWMAICFAIKWAYDEPPPQWMKRGFDWLLGALWAVTILGYFD